MSAKKLTLAETKKKMIEWRDFYGGDIIYIDEIKSAKNKKQLSEILDRYGRHLENVAIDAETHRLNFKKEIGLS